MAWPADSIEQWPLEQLVAYAQNARTHSDLQIGQIAASFVEFGVTMPVLIDEAGIIIAGHGRVLAAQKLNLTSMPVVVARDWSEAQKKAYRIADNKLALNAGWDGILLTAELTDLAALGVDLKSIGFSDDELAELLVDANSGLTDPDEVPPLLDDAVSAVGDVWILGKHRLVCGNCTDAETVVMALGGTSPQLMVTDPPYGVSYDPTWRNRAGVSQSKRSGKVDNDDRADWREAWALFPGDVAYVWHGALHSTTVAESLMAVGFEMRAQIVWGKERLVLGRGDYHWQHEPCWYAVRGKGHWRGGRKQTTLWNISSRDQDATTVHGTQKPVECMLRPTRNNSLPGETIYEPFCGSGTTIIAAELCGRVCHAIELNPTYVDVAVRRWQAFTGKEATLQGRDKTFSAVAAERGVSLKEEAVVSTR